MLPVTLPPIVALPCAYTVGRPTESNTPTVESATVAPMNANAANTSIIARFLFVVIFVIVLERIIYMFFLLVSYRIINFFF
jgi:hypothetical protein